MRILAITFVTLAACGTPLDTPDGGPPATPADGGGVCCPLTASEGCSSIGFFGGWAENGSQCITTASADGPPMHIVVDDHGCRVLRPDTTVPVCGRAVIDAGPDAASDASTDTPSTDAAAE